MDPCAPVRTPFELDGAAEEGSQVVDRRRFEEHNLPAGRHRKGVDPGDVESPSRLYRSDFHWTPEMRVKGQDVVAIPQDVRRDVHEARPVPLRVGRPDLGIFSFVVDSSKRAERAQGLAVNFKGCRFRRRDVGLADFRDGDHGVVRDGTPEAQAPEEAEGTEGRTELAEDASAGSHKFLPRHALQEPRLQARRSIAANVEARQQRQPVKKVPTVETSRSVAEVPALEPRWQPTDDLEPCEGHLAPLLQGRPQTPWPWRRPQAKQASNETRQEQACSHHHSAAISSVVLQGVRSFSCPLVLTIHLCPGTMSATSRLDFAPSTSTDTLRRLFAGRC
mmetsp:Transcript_13834/g.45125  ORF Transcript_13834/g.45125 Transcript_13834/m.45125 type:complete len:334 (+) Transcript_13834:724-1725(+)